MCKCANKLFFRILKNILRLCVYNLTFLAFSFSNKKKYDFCIFFHENYQLYIISLYVNELRDYIFIKFKKNFYNLSFLFREKCYLGTKKKTKKKHL